MPDSEATRKEVAIYGRVSSSDQRKDLDRQMARLLDYCTKNSLPVSRAVKEIGSGLNGRRRRLISLLKDTSVDTIVVEHRDRLARFGSKYLARFGSKYIEAALAATGRKVSVVENTEMKDDLVQDMIDVLTCLCARLYGRRGAKSRAKRALEVILG